MRSFIAHKSYSSFYKGQKMTFRCLKHSLEVIVRLKMGLYGVVTIIPENKHEISLICNWGRYFDRIRNCGTPDKVLERLKKPCPLTYQVLSGLHEIKLARFDEGGTYGLVKAMPFDVSNDLFTILGDADVRTACYKLLDISVKLYWEIHDNSPLKNWVSGLETIQT